MPPKTPNEAGSLIVVSGDHGELGFAAAFLRGQALAKRAAVLLPDNLHVTNRDSLPVPALPYRTLEDVLGVVDAHKPRLVFLFSGYLFGADGLLSPRELETLLRHLRERRCRVITSDPFLGLGPRLTLAQVDTRMLVPGQPASTRWLVLLMLRLRGSNTKVVRVPSLEDVIHLYATSIPESRDDVTRLAFFNPTVIREATASRDEREGRDHGKAHDPRPRWLFVLSARDLHVQCVLSGLRAFTEHLLGMLRHAVEADRQPTLIAPSSVVDRLGNAMPGVAELLPPCPLPEFEERVLDAEYVFSWNAFSFSHLARLANELPVFLFDQGYFARAAKPFYELARACHLGGWEPTYLDQRQLFSPYVLAHLAKAQKPAIRALRERWLTSPTPDALVDQLLGTGSRSESA